MRQFFRLCLSILLGWAVTPLGGSEPEPTAQYILLRDGAVIRGSVQEELGRVIVRQRQGSEIRLPRERLACWAPTLDGLYQYQVQQRTKPTIEAHLDLGRWCIRNEYFSGAAREIVAAHRISAGHESILRLERELRTAAQAATQAPAPETVAVTTAVSEPAVEHPAVPPPESDRFREFTTAIQPLLINQCGAAGCHGSESQAAFRLVAPPEGHGRPDAPMTQANLEAVVRWIETARPDASPLLVRSRASHGGSEQPPLGPRHHAAQQNLHRWVHALVSGDAPTSEPATLRGASEAEPSVAAGPPPSGSLPSGPLGSPVRLPHIADPFDPELFNRRLR